MNTNPFTWSATWFKQCCDNVVPWSILSNVSIFHIFSRVPIAYDGFNRRWTNIGFNRFQHIPWWSTYNAQYETAWGGRASINPNSTTHSKCRIANPSGNAKDYTYHGRKTLKFCTNYRQNLLYGRVLAELSHLWPHEGSRNEVECD